MHRVVQRVVALAALTALLALVGRGPLLAQSAHALALNEQASAARSLAADGAVLASSQPEVAAHAANQLEVAALVANQLEGAALTGNQLEGAALAGNQLEVAALVANQLEVGALGGDQRAVRAQAGATALEIRQVGWWARTLIPSAWNPVLVRVTGTGESDARGPSRVQVLLRTNSSATAKVPIASYGQEVALPAGVTKDVTVWIPSGSDASYLTTVQVIDPGGRVLAEDSTTAAITSSSAVVVGTLADAPTLATALGRIEIPYQQGLTQRVAGIPLTPDQVPTSADYLAGMSGLVVQGSAASTLTQEQRRAIQQWVVRGGHLVLSGGPAAQQVGSVLEGGGGPAVRFGRLEAAVDLRPLAEWVGVPGAADTQAATSGQGTQGGQAASPGQSAQGATAGQGSQSAAPTGQGAQPAAGNQGTQGGAQTAGLEFGAAAAVIEAAGQEGETLAGPRNGPLAWRARWGSGTLTFLAADPTLDPIRNWAGGPPLLVRLLEPALGAAQPDAPLAGLGSGARSTVRTTAKVTYGQLLASTLDTLPPEAFPSWQTVAGLLGGFALLAGPVLHAILWRADRRPWLWVAVPVLAIVATIAMYFVGVGLPGRDVLTSVISYVRLDPRTGQAQQSVAMLFVAPIREHLTATVPGSVALRPGGAPNYDDPSASGGPYAPTATNASGTPPFEVITGRDTRVEFKSSLAAGRWISFERDQREPLGTLETDLQMGGREPRISGTIRNATSYPLQNVALVIGQLVYRAGDLAPGQTATVDVADQALRASSPTYGQSLGWRIFSADSSASLSASSAPQPNSRPPDPESVRRMRLVDSVLGMGSDYYAYQFGGYGTASYGPVTRLAPSILAFTTAPLAGADLPSAGAGRAFHLALISEPIDVRVAPGPFTMPPALFESSVSTAPGATLYPTGYPTGSQVFELHGSATYTFRARLPRDATVQTMSIKTQQAAPQSTPSVQPPTSGAVTSTSTLGPSAPGTFQIYNWQAGKFEPLPAGQTSARIPQAGNYAGADGSVKVLVTSGGTSSALRFSTPEITLEGQSG